MSGQACPHRIQCSCRSSGCAMPLKLCAHSHHLPKTVLACWHKMQHSCRYSMYASPSAGPSVQQHSVFERCILHRLCSVPFHFHGFCLVSALCCSILHCIRIASCLFPHNVCNIPCPLSSFLSSLHYVVFFFSCFSSFFCALCRFFSLVLSIIASALLCAICNPRCISMCRSSSFVHQSCVTSCHFPSCWHLVCTVFAISCTNVDRFCIESCFFGLLLQYILLYLLVTAWHRTISPSFLHCLGFVFIALLFAFSHHVWILTQHF